MECYQQLPQVETGTTGAVFTCASLEHVPLSCKIFCGSDLGLGLLFMILRRHYFVPRYKALTGIDDLLDIGFTHLETVELEWFEYQ